MVSSLLIAALVTPALLYAGTAAASIPVLIHLFSRRRFHRVRWAPIEFLREADRQNRRRVRIEELVLLALRCLAMFFVGLMLARWFIRPQALAAILGSTARTERIVILDDSFSMGLRDAGQPTPEGTDTGRTRLRRSQAASEQVAATVLGRAARSVDRLVRWLRQESPEDSLTVLLTSRPDRPLRVEPVIGRMSASEFSAELIAMQPSSRAGNMPAAFAAARGLLDGRKGVAGAMVYVVSDFQQADWGRGNGVQTGTTTGSSQKSPASALTGWSRDDRPLRVVLMDVGANAPRNMAVIGIEPQQPQAVAGVSAAFTVTIANYSDNESPAAGLQVYVGNAAQPPAPVPAIPPRQTVEVPVEVTLPNEGSETVTVQLDSDALPIDNERSIAVPAAQALRILVVNGEPASDPYQDEVFLLGVALRPEGPQFSGNELTILDENAFEATDLSTYHVVVLANVCRVSEDAGTRLEEFVASGGGLQVFLGDQVDAGAYNRILYRDGKGLLPAKISDLVSARPDSTGFAFGPPNLSHPATRRFRDTQVSYFQGVSTAQFFRCELLSPATQAQSTPAAPLTTTRAAETPAGPASVLLRLDDEDKSPVLMERSFGTGHVVLSAMPSDKEWTNLPDRPAFVVLEMELIQYLAKSPSHGGNLVVGEPIRMALDPASYQATATLKLPTFPGEPAVRIDARPDSRVGASIVTWERTDVPGIYRFELTETAGAQSVRQIAVNVDSRESDLARADRATLIDALPGIAVDYVNGNELMQDREGQARRELWPTILAVLLCVLMAEQGLAWWFGAGRSLDLLARRARG